MVEWISEWINTLQESTAGTLPAHRGQKIVLMHFFMSAGQKRFG